MVANNEDLDEVIEAVLAWADEHPTFDTAFVESLQKQYENKGELTDRQEQALWNIIEQWEIEL